MFENDQLRFSLLFISVSSKFASSAAQIWISMAFSLSPRKYFNGKFCFSCLNSNSICKGSVLVWPRIEPETTETPPNSPTARPGS